MRSDDEFEKQEGGEGEGGEGQGGKTGSIQFNWEVMPVAKRDDLLPPGEIKRLLAVLRETHKALVTKQKTTLKDRAALKEGPRNITDARRGLRSGGGGTSNKLAHPVLANKAQFSGIDRQVTPLANENRAETNEEQRADQENRLELTHRNVPKFSPKPRPF